MYRTALNKHHPHDSTSLQKTGGVCPKDHRSFVLSIKAKQWKELICPSTDDWIKKLWSIFTMEPIKKLSAIKKNDFSTFAATWMALEEIMLSEISQAVKDNYHKVSHIYGT